MDRLKDKFVPKLLIPPGDTLLEILESLNLTQSEFSERTGISKKTVNQIIKGIAPISKDNALRFENVLNIPASFWNNLESNYREAIAREKEENNINLETSILDLIPYNEMVKLGWIEKASDPSEKIFKLRSFFGVASLTLIPAVFNIVFRMSNNSEFSPYALAAWIEKGRKEANMIITKPFDRDKLKKSIYKLKELSIESLEIFLPEINKICSDCGIALVLLPHLNGTYTHGAAKWLSSKKVLIQLSSAYKSIDIFWFSFFHEIGHIVLHSKKNTFIEFDVFEGKLEDEANIFAVNVLK